jgi:hypothetical protein
MKKIRASTTSTTTIQNQNGIDEEGNCGGKQEVRQDL